MALKKVTVTSPDPNINDTAGDTKAAQFGHLNYLVKKINTNIIPSVDFLEGMVQSMTIPAFISTWKTDNAGASAANQITLPLTSTFGDSWYIDDATGNYATVIPQTAVNQFTVYWGDGTSSKITSFSQAEKTHTYATPGTYTVTIVGTLQGFRFFGGGDCLKLMTITQWGCFGFDAEGSFQGCANLTISAVDKPRTIKTLGAAFYGCSLLNNIPGIESWNMTECISIQSAFRFAPLFNQNISTWNTSYIKNMNSTFRGALTFNQPIGTWDTSNVTDMFRMFLETTAVTGFNQNIGTWNTGKVRLMGYMFNYSQFNNGGSSSINNWDTSKVTNFDSMFRGCPFNQPIGNWNTGSATTLRSIFRDCPFNQDISAWNTSNVTQFPDVFLNNGCQTSCANWDVSKGQNFNRMFANNGFDFSLATWNLSSATFIGEFVYTGQTKFSTANYSAGLLYWATLPLKPNVTLNIGNATYSAAAQAARNTIISTYGWTVVDGGLQP